MVELVSETIQFIVPERSAQVTDLLLDGADAGTGLGRTLVLDRFEVRRRFLSLASSAAAFVLIALVAVAAIP